jgi:PAS domain S-box-containing protein
MSARLRSTIRYALAELAVVLAAALHDALETYWGDGLPFLTFYPAVMVVAWFAGVGPGILATLLAAVLSAPIWMAPRPDAVGGTGFLIALGLFVGTGLTVSLLVAARDRARASVDLLLRHTPLGLAIHDADFRYVRVNHALAEMNGVPARAYRGRTVRQVLGDAAADVLEPLLRRVHETREPVTIPSMRVRLPSAREDDDRTFSVIYNPILDARGRVTGTTVSVVDITARVRAERALDRERELLQTIIDTIPAMITMFESNTRVLRLNREFTRVTGWTASEAQSIDFMAACYPDSSYRGMVRAHMEAPDPGWIDLEMATRDGHTVQTSWSNVRLSDGSRIGIGVDISERKAREAELVAARSTAEQANRAKDQFLAMLGHELRNPLSAIGSAVAVLERLEINDLRGLRATQIIARQTQHLARLMDDLLDVGRVVTGKITLERRSMDLLAAARRAVATLRAAGVTERHDVAVDGHPVWVHGDATRLEQVVTNLVSNALKFTPPGGTIRVWAGLEDAGAVLRVSDTGAGMSAELLPRIFDLFVQGDQTADRASGGLGIGLTLVRQLVELHGGRIEARSAGAGQGSVFTIRLPLASTSAARGTTERPEAAPPCRILVVEDNTDARDMLLALLSLEHHDVVTASDGPAGVDAALRERPDIALIDIGLPGLNGYEVARRIRATETGRGIKLIALTGYGQAEDMRQAREAGFDLHLVKPVEPRRLDEALRSVRSGADPS